MKVVCAPDSFKESLSAAAAAQAMAAGISRAHPDAIVDCCPIGDGGEGTLAALHSALGGELRRNRVSGPLGEPLTAVWGLLEQGDLAVIEMAAAAGLGVTPSTRRDPLRTTTYGVGQLMTTACAAGAGRLMICVGGSATCDGGAGMAQALGVRFLNARNESMDPPLSGGRLADVARIDMSARLPALNQVRITVACDVHNPLLGDRGAARVFAPQKGADPTGVATLEAGLTHLARVIERDLGVRVADMPGAGAAGGLAAGLVAFADATLASGIELVLDAVGFAGRVAGADLVLTGEGRLDQQSLGGKACLGVAAAAARHGVPTVALVGAVGPGAERAQSAGLADVRVIGPDLDQAASMRRAPELLADAAARAVAAYL